MQIEVFSLCDAATVSGGKLNMLGVFDTIWARKIPTAYPYCVVALRIRFESDERGEHRVSVNFVDLDGKHIIPSVSGTINVSFPEEQRARSANLIFSIQGLKLERYSQYSIDLAIDNRRERSLPLFVRKPAERKSNNL